MRINMHARHSCLNNNNLMASLIEPLEGRVLLSASPHLYPEPGLVQQEAVLEAPLEIMGAKKKTQSSLLSGSYDGSEASTLSAVTYTPMTSAEFTTALNNAKLGDTIILQAGVTYTGAFVLPNKTTGSGWITIRSSNLHLLPAEGVRVSAADAMNMPRLQSLGSNQPVLRTAASAHHYRLVGIEFVGPANNSDLVTLVQLGDGGSAQNSLAVVPQHIHIDRSYLRPNVASAHIRRAIALHSAHTDITNSYIAEIHQPGSDSQAIGGWNGPGPYNIINNRLEGASENIMFGGARAHIPNMVPSDIVIRGNHIIKPLHWRGLNYNVKNLFELKAGARVLVEGNILENCWTQGQTGVAIVLKLGDLDSTPWNVTEDVIIRHNIIRGANGGVSIQGRDYAARDANGNALDPGGLVRRLSIINNVFDDINGKWSSSGTGGGTFFLYLTHGPKDVTFDHNTIFNGYTMIEVDTPQWPTTGFKWTNNIAAHNAYGVRSTSGIGTPTFNTYFTDAEHLFVGNILMGGNANLYTVRPGNFFPATWDAVGFVDRAGGNYRLSSSSPYRNAGTDGKDLGANIDQISAATAGALSGVWQTPPPQVQPVQASFLVNDGHVQRSMIWSIRVTFDQPVTALTGAFQLIRRSGGAVAVDALASPDLKTYTLSFSGSGTQHGSLMDGIYDLTVRSSFLRNSAGQTPPGPDKILTFHRLFGDSNGDKQVNKSDSNAFKKAMGATSTSSKYVRWFDFNADNVINSFDDGQFKLRNGTRLIY
jgi:hypothetical protein